MNNRRELQLNDGSKCPCKECHAKGENFAGCHDKCLKYIDWRQKKDVLKNHIYKEKYNEHLMYSKERRNK